MTSEKVAGMSKCHVQYFHTLLHQGMVHWPGSVMWAHNVCVCVCKAQQTVRVLVCFSQIWRPQVFKMYTYVAPSSTLSHWLSAKLCVYALIRNTKMTTVWAPEPQMMHRLKLGLNKHSLTNTVVNVRSHHVMRCASYLPWGKPLLFPSEKLEGLRMFYSDYNCHCSCNIMQREHRSKHFLINCHIFHFDVEEDCLLNGVGSSFPSNKFEKKKTKTNTSITVHTHPWWE